MPDLKWLSDAIDEHLPDNSSFVMLIVTPTPDGEELALETVSSMGERDKLMDFVEACLTNMRAQTSQ